MKRLGYLLVLAWVLSTVRLTPAAVPSSDFQHRVCRSVHGDSVCFRVRADGMILRDDSSGSLECPVLDEGLRKAVRTLFADRGRELGGTSAPVLPHCNLLSFESGGIRRAVCLGSRHPDTQLYLKLFQIAGSFCGGGAG